MRRKVWTLGVLALPLLTATFPARAQPPGHSDNAFQLRLGGFLPAGGGDLWDENEEVFTLDISDFDDFVFGLSYVHPVNNRLELGLNIDFYDGKIITVMTGLVYRFGKLPQLVRQDEVHREN